MYKTVFLLLKNVTRSKIPCCDLLTCVTNVGLTLFHIIIYTIRANSKLQYIQMTYIKKTFSDKSHLLRCTKTYLIFIMLYVIAFIIIYLTIVIYRRDRARCDDHNIERK